MERNKWRGTICRNFPLNAANVTAISFIHFSISQLLWIIIIWDSFQVVWREMQNEFIGQYRNIEELVERCYPDSNVTLEFTIQDILEFFSEIARSH